MSSLIKRWIYAPSVLLALVLVLLHTAPAKRGVRWILTQWLESRLGGSVEIGRLDYRLWKGELALHHLQVVPPPERYPFLLRAERISIRYSIFSTSLRVVRPRFTLLPRHGAGVASEAPGGFRLPALIDALEVENGTFLVAGQDEAAWLELTSIAARFGLRGDRYVGEVRSTAGRWRSFPLGASSARLEVAKERIEIKEALLQHGASRIEARGTVSSLAPLSLTADLDFRIGTDLLGELELPLDLSGALRGTATVRLDQEGLFAEGIVGARELGSQRLGRWAMDGDFAYQEGALELRRLTLQGCGGTVEVKGRIAPQGRVSTIDIRAGDLSVGELGRIASGRPFPIASRLGGRLALELTGWSSAGAEMTGRLELRPAEAAPGLPLGGPVHFTGRSGTLRIKAPHLALPKGELSVSGTLHEDGRWKARYSGRLSEMRRVDPLLAALGLPLPPGGVSGEVRLEGWASGASGRPASVAAELALTSERLLLQGESFTAEASIAIADERVRIDALHLFGLFGQGGRISATGVVPLDGRAMHLQGRVEGLDLSGMAERRALPVKGLLSGRFEASGPLYDPELDVSLRLSPLGVRDLTGRASLDLHKRQHLLILDGLEAKLGRGRARVSGQYDLDSRRLDLRVEAEHLSLASVLPEGVAARGLDGVVSTLEAHLHGRREAPGGYARLTIEELALRGTPWPALAVETTSDGKTARATVKRRDGGTMATASCRLESPYPCRVRGALDGLPLAAVLHSLVPATPETTRLAATGRFELSLPLLHPAELRYRLRVDEMTGLYREVRAETEGPFTIDGDRSGFRLHHLRLTGADTAVAMDGRVALSRETVNDLDLTGTLRLELLDAWARGAGLQGEAEVKLHIGGPSFRPTLKGVARIEAATVRWKGLEARELTLNLTAEGDRVHLKQLSGALLGGTFKMAGVLPLPGPDRSNPARIDFVLEDLDLAKLLPDTARRTFHPMLWMSARGSMEAPRLEPASIRATGEVSALRLGLGDKEIRAGGASPWSLTEGVLVLSSLQLTGTNTFLEVGLEARPADKRWQASLRGRVDNTFLSPLIRSAGGVVLTGTTDVRLSVAGTEEGPDLRGKGSLNGAQLVIREPPLVFSNLDGELTFDHRSIVLGGLEAGAGGGSVRGNGVLELSDWSELDALRLQMDIDSVRLNIPEGLRSQVSGALRLSGKPEELLLSGDIRLLRSSYVRNITLESELLSSLDRQPRRMSEVGALGEKTRLDLTVSTVEDLRIANNLARVQAQANVKITGTLAAPLMDGLLRSRSEGTFRLGPHTYRIDRGSILFTGYPVEAPELDLTARTTVGGVDIVIELRGRGEDLSLELRAPDRPELTRGDLASLLVTGRTLEHVSDLETVSGRERRILGEQLASYLGTTLAGLAQRGLGEAFRLDQIAVMPSQLGSEVSPELRFTLGKAIRDDLFLTYSIGLANTEKQLWMLDYKLPRRIELRATRQEDNTFTGHISQRARFDLPGRPRAARRVPEARRLGSVRLEGAPPGWEKRLFRRVRSQRDGKYEYWKAHEDAQRLERMLREGGYLGATVELVSRPTRNDEIALTFRIAPGPPIRVRWEGDVPKKTVRDSIEAAWDPRVPESFLLADLARLAHSELQRLGFYTARVEVSAGDVPGGARWVTFTVKKGPPGKRIVVEFEGNHALTARELEAVLPPSSSADFFQLLSAGGPRLARLLRAAYLSIGVLDARVEKLRTHYVAQTGEYNVLIAVDEGPQPRVTEVVLEGVTSVARADLVGKLAMIVGLPFRLSDYRRDLSTLVSNYREEGFPEARVTGRLERRGEVVRVVYTVHEGPRVRVRSVRVVGNHATDETLILRQATFAAGQPLRLAALAQTERRLYELGVFRSADVRVASAEDGSVDRDVEIRVEESSDLDFNYGLRFSSDNELDLLTELRAPNVFGRAHHASLTTRLSNRQSLLRATWHMPRFWKYALKTDLIASRETEDDVAFHQTRWKLAFQQSRDINEALALQWSYTYKHAHTLGKVTRDSPFPFDFVTRQSVLTSSLIEDRRDSLLRPTTGRFWSLTFQFAPEALGSDVRFIKLFGQLFYFHPLGKRLVWASSYRMGLARGFGQRLLPEDRFRAGGANTVRGFDRDALGPLDPITGTLIGGDAVVIYNQELRFPLYRWFRGVVFYDAGNIFLRAKDFRPFDLRHSAGGGLRLVLPFGLLRFDWAWVLDRRPQEARSRFWFSLNHAF